jgi:hypothetical protein
VRKDEKLDQSAHCIVELCDVRGVRAGLGRFIHPDSFRVELTPDDGGTLVAGHTVEVSASSSPIGPIRTSARIASVSSDKDSSGSPVVSAVLKIPYLGDAQRQELRLPAISALPIVLTLGLDWAPDQIKLPNVRFIKAVHDTDIFHLLAKEEVAILVLGPGVAAGQAVDILSRCDKEYPRNNALNIILGVGQHAQIFQDCIDGGRIYFLARGLLENAELESIICAAMNHFRGNQNSHDPLAPGGPSSESLLDFCIRISTQEELESVGGLLTEAVRKLTGADRSRILIYNRQKEILWSKDLNAQGGEFALSERIESPAVGLVAYVARTGEPVEINRIGSDPRYDCEADDPDGSGESCLVAVPIFGLECGERKIVLGVLTAVGGSVSEPFTPENVKTVKLLAGFSASKIEAILNQNRIQAALLARAQGELSNADIYRQEALDFHSQGAQEDGTLLMGSPKWLSRSHWMVVLMLILGLIFVASAKIDEVATGPCVIRATNRFTLNSPNSGFVRSIEVVTGDRVEAGDPVIRLQPLPQATDRHPDEDDVRAKGRGTITEILVRPGQQIGPGEPIALAMDETSGFDVIAFIPGSYAPQLRPGMQMLLKLQGYADSRELTRIDQVGTEILGPRKAAEYFGETVPIQGPVVLVRSHLQSPRFTTSGNSLEYRQGMAGQAEVSLHSDPMIVSLLPGLKEFLKR